MTATGNLVQESVFQGTVGQDPFPFLWLWIILIDRSIRTLNQMIPR